MVIELAPSLAEAVFGILPTVQLVEAVPTVVGVALAAPEEIVAGTVPTVVVPIVAAAPTGFAGLFVAVEQQQLARLALCDRCEGASRYITPGESPMQ